MSTMNRRDLLRYAAAGAATVATAGVGVNALTGASAAAAAGATNATAVALRDDEPIFEEQYKGRRITAVPTTEPAGIPVPPTDGGGTTSGKVVHMLQLKIDNRPLHIMPLDNGQFVSVMNHYEPTSDFKELARLAVDNLGDAMLADITHAH